MFKVLQSISCTGGNKNLDSIFANNNCILLLDGSTPLQHGAYDACRFNEDFISAFLKELDTGADVAEAVNSALATLFERFKTQNSSYGLEYYPSSTLLVAFECGESLRILCVGDSTAVIVTKNGEKVELSCRDVKQLDDKVISRLVEIRAERGIDVCDAMKLSEINEMMVENRKKMNQSGGYDILSFDMRKLTDDDVLTFDKADVDRVIFYSDGFEVLSDELIRPDANLTELYARLRREENDDALLNARPRFKVSDDASAIIFEIE